ncbi:unnamed protein product, partial [Staurois parvus]
MRTVQEMTADLWGGGERVPEFDRYPLPLPQSFFFYLTCSSIQPRAVFPASVMALVGQPDSQCACAREALRFVIGPAASGICH